MTSPAKENQQHLRTVHAFYC